MTEIPCGGFYIDGVTLKFAADGKTLYVASDLDGTVTKYALESDYAPLDNAHLTGTTTMESAVVSEELDCGSLSVGSYIICNGVDILSELQQLQARVRELEAAN